MRQKIAICYLHEDFVDKLLRNLYPLNFVGGTSIPKNSSDILVVSQEDTAEIRPVLGLNEDYEKLVVDVVYVEEGLLSESTKDIISKLEQKTKVIVKHYNKL